MSRDVSRYEYDQLLSKVEALTKELESTKERAESAEAAAKEAAANAVINFQTRTVDEVPTGRTRKIEMWDGINADRNGKVVKIRGRMRPGDEPHMVERDVPTFMYTIDLPPVGGIGLKVNEVDYYHGQTYEFDLFELRSIKEAVHRCWQHERSIHVSDENIYRKQTRVTLRGAGKAA